ncbi:LPS export ABC transporter periplasmic protein LptC [Pseudohoeflea coraliihabitans]|uniref:LPS export ABC transporter periplasmic protein LptC n=1 Tax=Pseudohoeflea coraliihabitans TaxID=2860393 RepID=A0ABS6WPM7_9HYPH|nr:LPS export ABC transporter periplasmic protein LptC [Pseudohoeflea sp. DP4N28-3]MBW3097593.1 LPS export ABC transporter periplasmic protein LptC [Pseudohoeflea sp. DP4N28-3]
MSTGVHAAAAVAGASERSDRQYRKALRHSRTVGRLKILLPMLSALLIAGFFAVSWLANQVPDGVTVTATAIEDGKLVMYRPTLTGENGRNQAYELRAARAVQDLTTPDIFALQEIVARVPIADDQFASLTAQSGTVDREAETLRFDQPFRVETDDGMTADLQAAVIDIAAGEVASDGPVEIRTSQVRVDAESMRLLDKGGTIIFEHKVRMTIDPKALDRGSEKDTTTK